MKKIDIGPALKSLVMISAFVLLGSAAKGQDTLKVFTGIPDSVNVIIKASCTPCHTNDGGLMSKSKLNFSQWTGYSPEKQKEKAEKMVTELNKGAMPPKSAREKRPDLIPTPDQIAIIRRWSESFPAAAK
jgi:hypothetical protein